MKIVHFRLSQITIPKLKNQNEAPRYLSVHIGPTFIELPLDGTNYLKSNSVISFEYDSPSNYHFDITLLEENSNSDTNEIASIEIPLRVCPSNKRISDHLVMEPKDEKFFDNIVTNQNDCPEEDDDESEEDEKNIIIFFEMHRSENNARKFKAPLSTMRNFNSDFLTNSRQSFQSSCSFVYSKNKSTKRTLPSQHDEENKENDIKTEDQENEKEPEDQEIENEPEDQENEKESENEQNDEQQITDNNEFEEIQQITDQQEQEEEQDTNKFAEEQEQENELSQKEEIAVNIEEEEECDQQSSIREEKITDQNDEEEIQNNLDEQNQQDEILAQDSIAKPGKRQTFLNSDDSDDYNATSEKDDTQNEPVIQDDNDEDKIPTEPITQEQENEETTSNESQENQVINLNSSAVYAVYPPKSNDANLSDADLTADGEPPIESNEKEEQPQQRHQELDLDQNQNEELQHEKENIQQENEDMQEQNTENLQENENQESNENNENDQNQNEEAGSIFQPFTNEAAVTSIDSNENSTPISYPSLDLQQNEYNNIPEQHQGPSLTFFTLDIGDNEIIDNFSFYPSPEQVGTFYNPPSLLPITINPPHY